MYKSPSTFLLEVFDIGGQPEQVMKDSLENRVSLSLQKFFDNIMATGNLSGYFAYENIGKRNTSKNISIKYSYIDKDGKTKSINNPINVTSEEKSEVTAMFRAFVDSFEQTKKGKTILIPEEPESKYTYKTQNYSRRYLLDKISKGFSIPNNSGRWKEMHDILDTYESDLKTAEENHMEVIKNILEDHYAIYNTKSNSRLKDLYLSLRVDYITADLQAEPGNLEKYTRDHLIEKIKDYYYGESRFGVSRKEGEARNELDRYYNSINELEGNKVRNIKNLLKKFSKIRPKKEAELEL